jgi:hypothetical protein
MNVLIGETAFLPASHPLPPPHLFSSLCYWIDPRPKEFIFRPRPRADIASLSTLYLEWVSSTVPRRGAGGSDRRKCVMAEEFYLRSKIYMHECK